MPVRLFYVDESYDDSKYCLSALSIRHADWKACFEAVRQYRVNLKADLGVYLRKEIHARDLVKGRGKLAPAPIGKWQRSRIFFGLLQLVASLPNVWLINICLDKHNFADPQLIAWERLVNRIERTLLEYETQERAFRRGLISELEEARVSNVLRERIERRLMTYSPRAVILADEGREAEITKAIRKMRVFNPIPSQFGVWPSGRVTQNITADRIIEDPIFKRSDRSYFIQLVDCVAFALLKREVTPTPHIRKYGINEMFDQTVASVCFRKASPRDPLGIVR